MKTGKAARATLADVARLAGVSLGSASRALSVPGELKPDTLARVLLAVEQLGYVRNGAAQALASRKTRTVAAIFPTLNNPIYADTMHALQQVLWESGYQLVVASHEYKPDRESDTVRAIVERGVDGIILVGTDHADTVFDLIRQYGLPYVLTWSLDETRYPHCVGFSNFDAAYGIAKRVIEYGHTRIALCVGVASGNERVRGRIAGVRAALREAGLALPQPWVMEQPFSFEGGRQAIRQLMQADEMPTALICGTDLLAIGAIDECRNQKICVPDALSVTGFDDIELAVLAHPRLTTVRVQSLEIGARAARRVIGLIEGQVLPPEPALDAPVVVRDSLRRLEP